MPSTRDSDRGTVLARTQGRSSHHNFNPIPAEDDDVETVYSDDLVSLVGLQSSSASDGHDLRNSTSSGGADMSLHTDRSKVFDDITNKHLLPEDTTLMLTQFEKAADIRFSRTYRMGKPVQELSVHAEKPHIGLVLLPGADLPEVNRLEQSGMVSKPPDQRTATWRVNTAGKLLSNIVVNKDLTLVIDDVTGVVASNAHKRMQRTNLLEYTPHQIARRDVDVVTIDSDNVELVHDFDKAGRELDLSATLIEVDVSSLFSLMHDCKHIISNSGPMMTFQETKGLLDRMMESARRFCVRSPNMFRMSTRTRIINSNNTHYGVDNELSFQTTTTSKGIQEIIHMAASYFNSLDPNSVGMDQMTQTVIRPRFLQMLTLLLSLLNDYDLGEMSDFLEKTYGFLPDRPSMELLFLKVIPLTSINPKVFLQGLIPAVERWPAPDSAIDNHEWIWTNFIRRLAKKGYLLPGTIEDMGHRESSWISKWPEGGINSSSAFSRLQFHGATSKSFNEVPTARFSYEPDLKELAVVMSNYETYTIHPADYEQISTLTRGLYSLTKTDDGTICDLEISEVLLNGAINEAVRVINDAISKFNFNSRPPPRQKRKGWELIKPKSGTPLVFRDIESANRLTRNQATLNGELLAVAYKLNNRNVPKSVAMRYMSHYYTKVTTLFKRVCDAAGRSVSFYEQHIGKVNQLLAADRKARQLEKDQPYVSDAAIAQALGENDSAIPSPKVWFEYWVKVIREPHTGHDLLQIQAKAELVAAINWILPGVKAEITLTNNSTKLIVAPLRPDPDTDAYQDELRVGDLVLLAGRYIVVATPQAGDFNYPCIMENWLEIQDSYSEAVGRRGRNFLTKEALPFTTFI